MLFEWLEKADDHLFYFIYKFKKDIFKIVYLKW